MTGVSDVTLRTVVGDDLAWARDFMAALGLPAEGLRDQFGDGYVIAEQDGKLVGLGGVEVYGKFGLIRSVGVMATLQRGAVGRTIVENRLEWARRRGLEAVYLLTETAPGFFERLGFERVERDSFPDAVKDSKEFAEVCPDSAVAMKLVL